MIKCVCTRCNGTGIFHTYGFCFACGGAGFLTALNEKQRLSSSKFGALWSDHLKTLDALKIKKEMNRVEKIANDVFKIFESDIVVDTLKAEGLDYVKLTKSILIDHIKENNIRKSFDVDVVALLKSL